MPDPTPLRIPRAADVVADHLRRQIVRGELAEGSLLPPEDQLRARFGVSGPTLRAAYRVLEHEGLVRVRRGAQGGATVLRPSADVVARSLGLLVQAEGISLVDLFGARVLLEPPLARELAARADPDDHAALVACLAEEEAHLGDAAAFAAATSRFHEVLLERSENRTVQLLLGLLWSLFEQHTLDAMAAGPGSDARARRRALAAHRRLTDLVGNGAAVDAERFWRDHMVAVGELFARRYGATAVYDLLGRTPPLG